MDLIYNKLTDTKFKVKSVGESQKYSKQKEQVRHGD